MPERDRPALRARAFELLEARAPLSRASRAVDVFIVTLIVVNVAAVMLESVPAIGAAWARPFAALEIVSVALFTVEYLLRLWSCVEHPDGRYAHPLRGRLRYARTPLAVVDLLAVLPFYLGTIAGIDLRLLRVARLVRVFKLTRYSVAMAALLDVLREESASFGAALFILVVMLVFASAGIYYFERDAQPENFASIPAAVWWAVATLTTVGYGDVTPITTGGRFFGGCVMIVGIGMVALPAGILASAFTGRVHARRESYGEFVDRALADGRISEQDRHRLERAREDLGLSREEARRILSRVAREMLAHEGVCPSCGAVIGRQRAPGAELGGPAGAAPHG